MGDNEQRAVVEDMVVKVFKNRPEDLARILLYFTRFNESERAIGLLFKLKDNPKAFAEYAGRLAEDTKAAEENPQFFKDMKNMYEVMRSFAGSQVVSSAGVGAGRAVEALAAVQLPWEAIESISDWWRGEISGKRCAKNAIDTAGFWAGGVDGGYAGAAVGTAIVPGLGTFVGGAVGSVAGFVLDGVNAEWLTSKIFDLPKSLALENAYAHLGISQSATNDEVCKAYHRKYMMAHPDTGGSQEKFQFLQIQMQIIKSARGL